jgi:hypothetical protein
LILGIDEWMTLRAFLVFSSNYFTIISDHDDRSCHELSLLA